MMKSEAEKSNIPKLIAEFYTIVELGDSGYSQKERDIEVCNKYIALIKERISEGACKNEIALLRMELYSHLSDVIVKYNDEGE